MRVRDIMTSNVITVSSDTPMVEAGKMMEFHRIERLPVVDRGKLVGIVTKEILERAAPSQATSLTRWELGHLLSRMKVSEIMKKDVVTIEADDTVECAIATAQEKRVGSLPVLQGGHVVGIVTTNDFFYKILNPIMGMGQGGSRISVHEAGEAEQIGNVMECLRQNGVQVVAMGTIKRPDTQKNDLVLHLDTDDPTKVLEGLKRLGLSAEARGFQPRPAPVRH